MTLDEAITHAREIAECGGECAEDHEQLAEWLEELRKLRAIAATLGSDASAVRLAERLRSIADEMRNVGASSMKPHELLACYASDVDKVADSIMFVVTLGRGTCKLELATDMESIRCSACGYKLPKGTDLKATQFCGGCGCEVER